MLGTRLARPRVVLFRKCGVRGAGGLTGTRTGAGLEGGQKREDNQLVRRNRNRAGVTGERGMNRKVFNSNAGRARELLRVVMEKR
jgi:hypothetical protein